MQDKTSFEDYLLIIFMIIGSYLLLFKEKNYDLFYSLVLIGINLSIFIKIQFRYRGYIQNKLKTLKKIDIYIFYSFVYLSMIIISISIINYYSSIIITNFLVSSLIASLLMFIAVIFGFKKDLINFPQKND